MINKFTSTYLQLQYRAFFMDPDFRIPIRTFADLDLDSGKKSDPYLDKRTRIRYTKINDTVTLFFCEASVFSL